jgi:hypothetical protein
MEDWSLPVPNIGDRLPLSPCSLCGGEQYEEYQSFPSYHNDTEERWVRVLHPTSSTRLCLMQLVKRVAALEKNAGQ